MPRFFTCFSLALAFGGLAACSKTEGLDTGSAVSVDIVATHDFAIEEPIMAVGFVPNDVAPWLGRIILLTGDGRLLSTDIEGRKSVLISKHPYSDIFGLMQIGAPGVFLALHDKGISAFIESDDTGGFSYLVTMMDEDSPLGIRFCQSVIPQESTAKYLSTDGEITSISALNDDGLISISVNNTDRAPHGTYSCAFDDKRTYTLSAKKGESILSVYQNETWKDLALDWRPKGFAVIGPSLAVLGATNILVLNGDNLEVTHNVNITNGLSIRGLETAGFITATSAKFGGAAYNEGVITLLDAKEQRLVFISLGFFLQRLETSRAELDQ